MKNLLPHFNPNALPKMLGVLFALFLLIVPISTSGAAAELKNLSVNGGLEDGKARLVIEAVLNGLPGEKEKLLYATSLRHSIHVSRDRLTNIFAATLEILQGEPKELALAIAGEGEIRHVTGDGLQDWSVRQETNGTRTLILRPRKTDKPISQVAVTITAEQEIKNYLRPQTLLTLTPPQAALFNGYVKVESAEELDVKPDGPSGLVPIDEKFLPDGMRDQTKTNDIEPLAYRFQGSSYSLPLRITTADPESRRVVLRDFKLTGRLSDQTANFTLTALARVRNPKGGVVSLLSGGVALTDLEPSAQWRLRFNQGQFVLAFDQPGEFPIQINFSAAVRQNNNWDAVDFRVAPSALQPIILQGLAADTQFQFTGAARPERSGSDFKSFLPPDGSVKLSWKAARAETEGKLFYSAEMLSQIGVGPGLMRQTALFDFKVMQGELSKVTLLVRGEGEVTRVQGDQVLAWKIEPVPNSTDRRLAVQFNQPQKDQFAVQVQMQTPLGAFPQTADAMQLRPEGATRFAGYFRIVNEGAVRLEIVQSTGLSQISPEQFPESDATKSLLRPAGSQRFAYRFSGADFGLRIQADQILPEVSVSELLSYHLAENELAIETEIELDIREAPLRELQLSTPKGYAIARISAQGLSDYFLREPQGQTNAELQLIYGQPVTGRLVVQLRLERNQALGAATWTLPPIEVAKAKSVRGHLAVSADAGFRLTPERTRGLTEIATAFFPRKLPGIQSAFRLSDANWQATVRVERLQKTVQADVFHLFSIGEGIAYGSSVMNYSVSGAPVSVFQIELANEYYNVEFTGKDIRNWQKTTNGFVVQLHTPVSGAYTMLATYERPFKPQGETLAFTGARPLDAQTEQGHTIVISAYQFQVTPVEMSPGLLPLETGEVPPEYRLFFDSPILAAYRYTSRPFNLRLALSPLAQGDSLSQVVDRASLVTHISKEGQVLTDARYFVKNRGHPHFRFTLPEGMQLWSATVNGASVVPVTDTNANLIPLPQRSDPNAVLTLDLKLAAQPPKDSRRVSIAAPVVAAPVMLAEWKLEPDTGQRLVYVNGSLTPMSGIPEISGFVGLTKMFSGEEAHRAVTSLLGAFVLLAISILVWRWTSREGVYKFSAQYLTGTMLGLISLALAFAAIVDLTDLAAHQNSALPRDVAFLAPVQQASSALSIQVANVPDKASAFGFLGAAWPALFAVGIWLYGWMSEIRFFKTLGRITGWTLIVWAALRWPNGAEIFFWVIVAFLLLHVAIPALRRLWRLPRKPKPTPTAPAGSGTAPAAAAILLGAFLGWGNGNSAAAAAANFRSMLPPKEPPLAESITQKIRVEEKFAFADAKIRWHAVKGQLLPVLFEPGVLTRLNYPTNALKLVEVPSGVRRADQLLALESGDFDVEMNYQVHINKTENESAFVLPTQYGLINHLNLTLVNLDVDVTSPQAVSVQRDLAGSNTVATVYLSPVNDSRIVWRPRSRDVKREKAVFYADFYQLYIPTAGVIEGAHYAAIRPAQGELGELVFTVPTGATVTDVNAIDPATRQPLPPKTMVSLWRFDPDAHKLRVNLSPAQSRPFALLIRTQVAAGPLPFEQSVGLISADGAASQIGLLGIATGTEVQLDNVSAAAFSSINLEDFPGTLSASLPAQFPGLTVRRAFRYSDVKATASIKASSVEPDVRVETQDTLSLAEDRLVLASNPTVDITRAGIFRLSFILPTGLDVESISGPALSHWTELKSDAGRVITLHLKGKTVSQQKFAISLAGAGIKPTNSWAVPQVVFREASKQRGTLVIVPEQGMRLQPGARNSVTQLDPQKSGVRQKGVLAFHILQTPWSLALDIEQVDPWIQVTSLQHAIVNEAQVKVAANLQYQIENTGLKAFRIFMPTNAESVNFIGDQIADFLPVAGAITNSMQTWEVKLHRRVIGPYLLRLSYQTLTPEQATETALRGVQAVDVNLQRGFVTVQSSGRLQVRVDNLPAALQPTEWQSIPRALQQELPTASANFAYRLVEPAFLLPLKIDRHVAVKLLSARVNSITLTSVISDAGVMLTQARLEMLPGDKRLLYLTLPKEARFWFAFVNQNGVWPWSERDRILIPLEQQSRSGKPIQVELFFSSQIGAPSKRELDLELLGPKFDLPLENITWRVFLNQKWQLKDWKGSLQLQEEQLVPRAATADVTTYLQNEAIVQREKTKEAEQMLALGNSALEQGDSQQARRAFQAAFGLSQGDQAFNEDARVQLNNLKLQQALVGLNVRQAATANATDAFANKLRDLRGRKEVNYTQQDAKAIIDRNSADENAAFMRLAQRLIQQQDAAVSSPAAIHASVPEQGRLFTFKRSVAVDPQADLKITLQAKAAKAAPLGTRFLILLGAFIALAGFSWATRSFRGRELDEARA